MAGPSRGLGRGLDALFKGYQEQPKPSDIRTLPLRALHPNPNQPRKMFTEAALEELAASIRSQGVLQPLLVRPIPGTDGQGEGAQQAYEIVAGERRWRASQMAGLREVPVLIRELTDQETLAVALIENLQREDLNPMEEALAMQELREQFGLSQEDLAQKLGKSRPAVANTLRLLHLPESAREDVREARLSAGHARALLTVTDPEPQDTLRRRILSDRLSVREAEAAAAHWRDRGALPEPLAVPPKREEARPARPPQRVAPSMRSLQGRLHEALSLRVSVSGTEEKGKITLNFESSEQLALLLSRLGLEQR